MKTVNSTMKNYNYRFSAKCDTNNAINCADNFLRSGDVDDLKQAKAYIDSALKMLEKEEENNAG